jgi:2-polyprenyl-3-methyl-5-hydroxy-6-metoxy-1,4-benzoquinol methylase
VVAPSHFHFRFNECADPGTAIMTIDDSLSTRVSPLLDERGPEEPLSYAPAPWILKKCLRTEIVFLANPPGYEALEETFAYEVTFAKESEARKRAEPVRYAISSGLKYLRKHVLKRDTTLRKLRALVSSSKSERVNILDVGCGWASLLDNLFATLTDASRSRCAPHGIEISRELSRISDEKLRRWGGRCVQASAYDGINLFDENYFDVIVMASYLEHEANPLGVLQRCASRLKPDGVILIKVPNFACVNRRIRGARWCGFRWPDHVNYFTPATLRRTAELAGLEVARMTPMDVNPLNDNMYAVFHRGTGSSKTIS